MFRQFATRSAIGPARTGLNGRSSSSPELEAQPAGRWLDRALASVEGIHVEFVVAVLLLELTPVPNVAHLATLALARGGAVGPDRAG